jgi:hypothetical protein
MMRRLLSPASRYSLLFALTVGLFFILSATGLYARFFFSLAVSDQTLFLAHLVFGYLFIVPFLWYLYRHLRLVVKTRALHAEYFTHLLGLVVTVVTVAAVVTGVDLSINGSTTARVHIKTWHQWGAYAGMVLLPAHVLWALVRRLQAKRASSIPVEDRFLAPAIILAGLQLIILLASFKIPPPTPTYTIPKVYTFVKNQKGTQEPFFPGQARTVDGKLIPIDHLSQSDRCAECHKQIFDEWNSSTHRFSAINDHYLAQVKLRIHDVPIKPHLGARFCANCHEPIALFSGEIDPSGRGIDFPENRQQGISCLSCHRTEALHSGVLGNANMIVAPHMSYIFEKRTDEPVAAIGRTVLRSKPDIHKKDLMRPLLRKSEFCSSCHKFFIDEAVNGHGFFRLQNTFDEWKQSPFGGDPKTNPNFKSCQDCHMPLVDSKDPAAKPYTENGATRLKHRSHRFLGANTARPFLDGDKDMLVETQKFLTKGDVVLSLTAPAEVKAGETAKLKVTVVNKGVGHKFPTGTVDTHDCYLEVEVKDAKGNVVLHSGFLEKNGDVDPNAHRFGARAVDENGEWLYRRDMWNLAGFEQMELLYMSPITKSFDLAVPRGTPGPLSVVAKLQYRKYNQKFTRFVFGRGALREESGYTGKWTPDVRLPITTISQDSAKVELQAPKE